MPERLTLSGVGLHSGVETSVQLARHSGPITLTQNGVRARLADLRLLRTDHGVEVTDTSGALRIDLVEHLFAAIAAKRSFDSLEIAVHGPELPLLDGGAEGWCRALSELDLPEQRPSHVITRPERYAFESACYELIPGPLSNLDVITEFAPPLGVQQATYAGSFQRFREEIARARTFGFLRDRARLEQAGRAGRVDPHSVLVFNDDGSLVFPASEPRPNELAAHKLLDLVGDSLFYGGLPLGRIIARRPGHTANHAMFQSALADAVIVPRPDSSPCTF